jgi:TPR repeat protein
VVERFIAPVLKTGEPSRVPGVRIPPPLLRNESLGIERFRGFLFFKKGQKSMTKLAAVTIAGIKSSYILRTIMKDERIYHRPVSAIQSKKFFEEGYRLAFLTRKKIKPWDEIFELWLLSASSGNIRAQFYLGTCYDHGYGTTKDIAAAFDWFLKAARKGKMEAQFNIGYCYHRGEFVRKNYKKAVHWFSLAAKQGDTEAQRDLGYCYFYGQGVKKDASKGVKWYKKAAAKKDDKALYNLGLCYEYGDGTKQSNRWARHYFLLASKLGHVNAKVKLKNL